jgi:UDP-glucose 4-epimerase
MSNHKLVVVTGSSGYIGGQTVLTLKDAGHTVIGVDHRAVPDQLIGVADKTLVGRFESDHILRGIEMLQPDAIVHCAGTSLVGPSVMDPDTYYENNFVATKKLLDYMRSREMKTRFIFSSSAATYGEPVITPCSEVDPAMPVSPYGESKLMVEMMLAAYHQAYGLDYVAFRYFNACGADSQGRHGQMKSATHIIARVLESIRDSETFTLNGTDYQTDDGTCVRDYVHVEDIAYAHQMAMYNVVPTGVYNLGTSVGASNLEIIRATQEITGQKVNVAKGPRRAGDPAVLTASSEKFNRATGWVPRYNIHEIIQHAWKWYVR